MKWQLIYKIAEKRNYKNEFYDSTTGLTFKFSDYKRYQEDKSMRNLPGIPVFKGMKFLGYLEKE